MTKYVPPHPVPRIEEKDVRLSNTLWYWLNELRVYINEELAKLLDRMFTKLSLDDNFDGQTISVPDTGIANTEFIVSHNLKRTPSRFLLIDTNVGGSLYKSGTAWDSANVYFKYSGANANVRVFIW